MAPAVAAPHFDINTPRKVSYCIPTWLRDEQIKRNISLVDGRLEPSHQLKTDPIAVVCYGPSLNQTWESIKDFKYVLTCSGAHKFMIERGVVPTWHVDVDPRPHKIKLIGEPHPDVEYLLASTCSPDYFKMLKVGGFKVRLWHVFDGAEEAMRVLPPEEWALTGGCSVGLRALAIARFLGFRKLDVFGMDGCEGETGKHAADHPNQANGHEEIEYGGRVYRSTAGFLEAARQTPHEMDDLKDVDATFHGDGLVQAIMRDYKRTPIGTTLLAFSKPTLISRGYVEQNRLLHEQNLAYGVSAGRHAERVKQLLKTIKTDDGTPASLLDYGCGKGYLAKSLSFPIFEYDPAIPGKTESPRPADMVCCFDVLEHIEPEYLMYVLNDLHRCAKQLGYFVINTGPAQKKLPDGRNTHLIQQPAEWWVHKLKAAKFNVAFVKTVGNEVHVLVSRGQRAKQLSKPLPEQHLNDDFTRLDFSTLVMRTEPYLIGAASGVVEPTLYHAMVAQFPEAGLFKSFGGGNKISLSTVQNAAEYQKLLASNKLWNSFNAYVRDHLVDQMREVLKPHGVDMSGRLKARWEFSILPGNGGDIRPHTDIASKIITLVLSMRGYEEEWPLIWGGGTDVLKPKQIDGGAPLDDYKADWSAFDIVDTYQYFANQCVVFVKSDASWHGVRPLTGPAEALRRTLTINIERQP